MFTSNPWRLVAGMEHLRIGHQYYELISIVVWLGGRKHYEDEPARYCEDIEHCCPQPLLRTLYCGQCIGGHSIVDTLLWTLYCGQSIVDTLLWTLYCGHYCGHSIVDTLLWTLYCGHSIVDTLLWTLYCGHSIVDTVLWTL